MTCGSVSPSPSIESAESFGGTALWIFISVDENSIHLISMIMTPNKLCAEHVYSSTNEGLGYRRSGAARVEIKSIIIIVIYYNDSSECCLHSKEANWNWPVGGRGVNNK